LVYVKAIHDQPVTIDSKVLQDTLALSHCSYTSEQHIVILPETKLGSTLHVYTFTPLFTH